MRLTLCVLLSFSTTVAATPFYFFGGRDIDYWREGRRVGEVPSEDSSSKETSPKDTSSKLQIGPNIIRSQDTSPFAWDNYKDPKKAEFWDDGGDWVPPRPFREAAASPTEENIRAFLRWQEQKSQVIANFQKALDHKTQKALSINWSEVKLAYFYQSSCPHCQASAPLVEELKKLGVQVTGVQIGEGEPLHTPSFHYDAQWAREFQVKATPTWVIQHRGRIATLTGYITMNDFKRTVEKGEHDEK